MTVSRDALYEITIPFGLLKDQQPDVAQALIDSGGPWEVYDKDGWVDAIFPGGRSGAARYLTYRLKRPEPPMTDGEFIAAAAIAGVCVFDVRSALRAWHEGNYDDALRLIGATPGGGE